MSIFRPKITVVIPAYSNGPLCQMTYENARVWKEMSDELIITEDGEYCSDLHYLADLYVLHKRMGVAENSNIGWWLALDRGADYVAIMDTDVEYVEGNLRRDLCQPGKVGVPQCIQYPERVSVAPMLVVSAEVVDTRGVYDSNNGEWAMKWFDQDYGVRVSDLIVKVDTFKISHVGGATTGGHHGM